MSTPAFDTFNQYAFGNYAGQIEDRNHADVVSRLAIGGAIGYGLAVTDTGERSAQLPGSTDIPYGITVRETIRDNPAGDNPTPEYPEDHEMSVIRVGRIHVTTTDGSAVGEPVYVTPSTGVITNDPSGSLQATPDANNTGDGTAGSLAVVSGAIPGRYRAVLTATATDGGTFTVYDPNGANLGTVDVGNAFDNGIQFTISDGAADFVIDDQFYFDVTTTNILFPNAKFKTAASAGALALVQLDGNA